MKSTGDSALDMVAQNSRSNEANQKAVRKVRAVVVQVNTEKAKGAGVEGEAQASETLPEDPFGTFEREGASSSRLSTCSRCR